MATTSPNVTPNAPRPGHPQRAHGEVFVVRINFHLHGARQFHLYFFE